MKHRKKISNVTGMLAATAVLLVSLASCSKEKTASVSGVGDRLPSFTLTTDRGLLLTDMHLGFGDCILVFFSTMCPDCRRELPVIDTFYRNHPEKTVIAVSREEKEQDVMKMWYDLSLTLPYSVQKDRSLYNKFTDSGVPYTVIARKGIITAIFTDTDGLTTDILEQQFK